MRILLYEYLTGGGLWSEVCGDVLSHPLVGEGRAMVQALGQDLCDVAAVELVQFQDARLAGTFAPHGQIVPVDSPSAASELLVRWAAQVDGVILIAPEIDGRLWDRCRSVEQAGGQLLSPDSDFIALTMDKDRTAQRLTSAGMRTPPGQLLAPGAALPESFDYPAVWKPNDGVGSTETFLIRDAVQARQVRPSSRTTRIERYHAGVAASVSALCGPRGATLLPPCRQRLSDDGRFQYLGGAWPLDPGLANRACRLARGALAALPDTVGYVGIDLVLGEDDTGNQDVVLEVNPRLTTSYVGLREAATTNLAAAMLRTARGRSVPLFFHLGAVEFEADGRVTRGLLASHEQ